MALRGGIGDHSAFGFSYTQGSGSEETNVRIETDTATGGYDNNTTPSPNQTTQNAGTEEFDIYGQDSDPTTRTQSTPDVNNPTVSTTSGDNGVPENNTNPGSPTAPDSPPSTTNPASQQAPQNSSDGSGPATPAGQNSNPISPQQPQQPQFGGGAGGATGARTPVGGGGAGEIAMGNGGGASQATTNAIGNGASDLGDTPATDAVTEGQEIYYEIEDPITHEIRRVNQEEYDVWVAQVNEEKRNALKEMGFNDYDINRIIYQGVDAQALYQRILDRTETDPNATSDEALYEAMYFMSLRGEIPKIPGVELTLEDFDYTSFAGFDEHVAEVVAFANMLSEQAFLRDIDENTAIYLLIQHMAGGFENLDDAYKNTIIAFRTVDEYGIVQYWYNPGGPPPIPQGMDWEYVRFNEFYGDSEMYKEMEELIPWREEEVSDAGFWFWTWGRTKIETVRTINFNDPAVLAFYERVQQQYQDHYIIWWEKPEEVVAAVSRAQALSAISNEIHHNLEYNMENIFAYIKQPDWAEYCKFDYVQVRIVENAESRVIYDGYGMGYLYITTDEERAAFLACVFAGKAKISGSYVYTDHGCYQVSDGDVFNHYMQKWATETDQNGNPIISDQEKAIFMYILNKQGAEAAIDYIEGIADEVDTRYYRAETSKARAWAQANWFNGVLASIASVIITPFEGIGAFFNSVGAIGTDHIWRSDVISYGNVYRSAVSEAIRYKHNADGSIMVDETGAYVANHPTLAFIYDTGMSIADTAAMIVVGYFTGGSGFLAELAISTVMMGSRVYVSSLNDALDRGVSPRMAVIYAIGTSAIESLMEAYSLGHLVNLEAKLGATSINLIRRIGEKTGSQFITANAYILACMISQAICEADEELCTEILDTIWDNVICQDLSSFNLTMAGYMQAGESHDQAFFHALLDKGNDCFQAWLGGLASGLFFGAVKGGKIVIRANGSMDAIIGSTGGSVGQTQTQLNLQDTSANTAAQLGKGSMTSGAVDYSQAQPGIQSPSSSEATTEQLMSNSKTNVSGLLDQFNVDSKAQAAIYAEIIALYDGTSETIINPQIVNTLLNANLSIINANINNITTGEELIANIYRAINNVNITAETVNTIFENLQEAKFKKSGEIASQMISGIFDMVLKSEVIDSNITTMLSTELTDSAKSLRDLAGLDEEEIGRLMAIFVNGELAASTKYNEFFKSFREHAGQHTALVAAFAVKVAQQVGLSGEALEMVRISSACHDLGMQGGFTFEKGDITVQDYKSKTEDGLLIKDKNGQVIGRYVLSTTVQNGQTIEIVQKVVTIDGILTGKPAAETTRKNHPLNSAITVLVNQNVANGLNPSVVALLAMSHSKSTSGISSFATKQQWIDSAQKLQNAIAAYNAVYGTNITFDIDAVNEILNDPTKFAILQDQALAIRAGDAMSDVAKTLNGDTILQPGGYAHIDFDVDAAGNIQYYVDGKLEISDFSAEIDALGIRDTLYQAGKGATELDFSDFGLKISARIHVGEGNVLFQDSYTIGENGARIYYAEAVPRFAGFAPICTSEAIFERIGEVITYDNCASRTFEIKLPTELRNSQFGRVYEEILAQEKVKMILDSLGDKGGKLRIKTLDELNVDAVKSRIMFLTGATNVDISNLGIQSGVNGDNAMVGSIILTMNGTQVEVDISALEGVLKNGLSSLTGDLSYLSSTEGNIRIVYGDWAGQSKGIPPVTTGAVGPTNNSIQTPINIADSTLTEAMKLPITEKAVILSKISSSMSEYFEALNITDMEDQQNFAIQMAECINDMYEKGEISVEQIALLMSQFIEAHAKAGINYNAFFKSFREHSGSHSALVTEYALKVARQFGLTGVDLDYVKQGAICHDLGMKGGITYEASKMSVSEYKALSEADRVLKNSKGEEIGRIVLVSMVENGQIVEKVFELKDIDKLDDGAFKVANKARKNHPLNSAMVILTNPNLVFTDGSTQLNPSIVALLAMSHSKSTSGISSFATLEQWQNAVSKLSYH